MVEIQVQGAGAFQWAWARLEPGESFLSESGAMFRTTENVEIDVTARPLGSGFFGGIKRLLAAEHFFFSRYTVSGGGAGEVGLAPPLPGEVRALPVEEGEGWLCAGGSYLASTEGLQVDTRFQGIKGLVSAAHLFFLQVQGKGTLLVSGFGRLVEMEVEGETLVDSGHVAAFTGTLDFQVTRAGSSWIHAFLAGEGFVLRFRGRGRVLVQSHDSRAFGKRLGVLLPPRRK